MDRKKRLHRKNVDKEREEANHDTTLRDEGGREMGAIE
jgi:hypothetical protein